MRRDVNRLYATKRVSIAIDDNQRENLFSIDFMIKRLQTTLVYVSIVGWFGDPEPTGAHTERATEEHIRLRDQESILIDAERGAGEQSKACGESGRT
jgi:hypothetical protein